MTGEIFRALAACIICFHWLARRVMAYGKGA